MQFKDLIDSKNIYENYVAIEGIDGTGKTTLFTDLKVKLFNDRKFRFVQEPDKRVFTQEIYELLSNKEKYQINIDHEVSLFHLSRLAAQKIPRANDSDINMETFLSLNDEHMVISDRSIFSSLAYQANRYNSWFDTSYFPEDILKFNSNIRIPGKIVYLDLSINEANNRVSHRPGEVNLFIKEQKQIKENYEYVLKNAEKVGIKVLRVGDIPVSEKIEQVFEFLFD